ncbi:MAG TPA: class I SAM-dependent methyltransferase [Anaerolineae bacterium]
MTLDDFYFLLTPQGQRLLQELSAIPITPQNHLQLATQLRQQVAPELAQAVLETTLLRQLAVEKFSRADQMYFTRPALEQASAEIVSTYRAGRYAVAGFSHIADLGCSVGGDALALAAEATVTGIEWDEVRLAMAQENVRVYGHGERFHPLQADLTELSPLLVQALFFDPARRDERGRRFFSVHQYQPPLDLIDRWRQVAGNRRLLHAAVKISPGVDYAELPPDAEIEFISVTGDVREGVLWYGELHSGVKRRATLLPGVHTLTTEDLPTEAVAVTAPSAYLYEPDGAVIRAHLVEALAARLGATKIDAEIAYLTAASAQETPFARCFAVEATFPFQLKRLRHYLQAQGIGRVTVKKRGSPLDPDQLRRQLRLRGDEGKHRIVFLTHIQGEAAVLIGQELTYYA